MKNTLRYSTEPSAVSMIIGVATTLLGLGLALGGSDGIDPMNLAAVGALVSALGALGLGVAQNGRISAAIGTED